MPEMKNFVGFTDAGQPLVVGEGRCEHFQPGKHRLINEESCWYCRYADFRKTIFAVLTTSVCRCAQNQVCIQTETENERLEAIGEQGGERHA